eukprot:316906-Prymnesium_polylepis.4
MAPHIPLITAQAPCDRLVFSEEAQRPNLDTIHVVVEGNLCHPSRGDAHRSVVLEREWRAVVV